MNTHDKAFIKLVKKRLITITVLIIMLIYFLSLIIITTNKNIQNQSVLINVFGRQRMLTQMISKDINRKYAIMLALEKGPLVETRKGLNDKVSILNSSLYNAQNEFESVLYSLNSGELKQGTSTINFKSSIDELAPTINKANATWSTFNQSVNIIKDNQKVSTETARALIFINEHNEKLLGYCDEITQTIIDLQKRKLDNSILVILALFSISLMTLLYSIIKLQNYIVIPLNQLYIDINQLGILNKNKVISLPSKKELAPVIKDIHNGLSKLNKLIELIENINKDISFDEILKYIYLSFSEFIPYSHIGIALLKDDMTTLEASYGISDSQLNSLPQKLIGIKAKISNTSLNSVVWEGIPRVINDLEEYTKNSNALYNKILVSEGVRSSISLPLKINDYPIGIIFFSSVHKNIYKDEHIAFLETLSNSISICFNQTIFIDELLYSSILALAKMAEARDEDTGDHLERMKQYSKLIAEFLLEDKVYSDSLSISFIRDIERFSPMHDIGKVGIKDGILLKPAKLTPIEFEEMKKHTIYGAEVLTTAENNIKKQKRSLFKTGIEIAQGHHEKWDGSGYPYKISGQNIPLSARIVSVADVFDALTSKRPYKEAFPFEYSFDILVEGRGKSFDPNIIDSCIRHKNDIFKLYTHFYKEEISLQ